MSALVGFLSGVMFAVGLVLAGMTQPAKVTGFLDITGAWDPSLAFVMVGAIGVHAITRRWVLRREKPFGAPVFDEPTMRSIDARLVAGAAIFGVGWGASGYCPGPAVVALGTGSLPALVFVASAAIGMEIYRRVDARSSLQPPASPNRSAPAEAGVGSGWLSGYR
jgi:uncharacterized membrane protein YedE/YeeE